MSIRIRPRKRVYNNRFVGGFFLAIGGTMMAALFWMLIISDAREARSWPTVTGTVVTSQVMSQVDREGAATYGARVLYEYQVDDQTYQSSKITVADGTSSRSRAAEAIVDRYPTGSEITVYYNPRVPQSSLLETSVPQPLQLIFYLGLVLAGFGILIMVRALVTWLLILLGVGFAIRKTKAAG